MVLPDPQVVGGDARVLPAVERLGHVDLQRPVLMDHVVLAVLDADLAVFEPAGEKETRELWPLIQSDSNKDAHYFW